MTGSFSTLHRVPSLGAGQTDNFSGEFQSTSDNLTFVTSILLHPTIIFNTESQYNHIQNTGPTSARR